MYGSTLWNINCEEHHKLTRSWNTAVKMVWDLPPPTHKNLLEPLSPVPHLESVLTGRYIGFLQSLAQSCKSVVQLLFHSCYGNIGTNTGQNLKYLKNKHNIVSLKTLISEKNQIKKLKLYTLPSEESWKLNIIEEISLVKKSYACVHIMHRRACT